MKIRGVCWIANKYQQQEKNFTRHESQYGKLRAEGKIKWSDKSKDKNGNETKAYVEKLFTCFDAQAIDKLEALKNDMIEIEGRLKVESFIDKKGDKRTVERVYIEKVSKFERLKAPEHRLKEDANWAMSEKDSNIFDNLDIPF